MNRQEFRERTNNLMPGQVIAVQRIDPMPILRDAASKTILGTFIGRTVKHLLMTNDRGQNLSHFHTAIERIEVL